MTESQHIIDLIRRLRKAATILRRAGAWGQVECHVGGCCGRLDMMLGVMQYDCNRDVRLARPLKPRSLVPEIVYAARLLRQRRFVLARRVLIRVLRTAEDHAALACTRTDRAWMRTAKRTRGVT